MKHVKQRSKKSRMLLARPVETSQLPEIIPRWVAANYALVSIRTLQRFEKKGYLTPIRRGLQGIAYKREELLRLVGILK
jgi:hypothetical protein